jgi:hypothetical protein
MPASARAVRPQGPRRQNEPPHPRLAAGDRRPATRTPQSHPARTPGAPADSAHALRVQPPCVCAALPRQSPRVRFARAAPSALDQPIARPERWIRHWPAAKPRVRSRRFGDRTPGQPPWAPRWRRDSRSPDRPRGPAPHPSQVAGDTLPPKPPAQGRPRDSPHHRDRPAPDWPRPRGGQGRTHEPSEAMLLHPTRDVEWERLITANWNARLRRPCR